MINKIMKFFGYVSESEIFKKGKIAKDEHDKKMYDLSKRIQTNYYTQDIHENSAIATEILSDNTIGEYIVELVT